MLGKYTIERELGRGGMGVVFAVRHRTLDELFAIKLLQPGQNTSNAMKIRFLREARTCARLTSNHATRVHDTGYLDDGTPYLLMEYLEGQELGAYQAARGRLQVEEAVELMLQACDAIAEAHSLGLVHRDLKPSNMFLTRRHTGEPHLKVLDFGITKQLGSDQLTLTGEVIGTPRYMSPEQAHGSRQIDARSDIWALGVILYELTTGVRPFQGDTLASLLTGILTEIPARPSEVHRELPVAFDAAVMRCLEKDPERRYHSLDELIHDLRPFRMLDEEAPVSTLLPRARHRARAAPTAPRKAQRPNAVIHATEQIQSLPTAVPAPRPPQLEQPDGIVSSRSPFYLRRTDIEQPCMAEIVKTGALLRLKGPRQMGKTTLMTRLLEHAVESGARTVRIDLKLADARILGDLDQLLRWLCAVVRRRLKLARSADEDWDDIFGPKDNCLASFEDSFLPAAPSPLVLALSSVDRLFEWPQVADEFLTLVRALHEMSKSQDPWTKLRLVLEYSTEMYLPMDINHSPLNVGLAITLTEWQAEHVIELAHRHGLAWGEDEIASLMGIVGGHPYLIRVALYHAAKGMPIDSILASAATASGVFSDHLKKILWKLQQLPDLAEAAARVFVASGPIRISTELAFKLVSLGLVRHCGNDEVEAGIALYRKYLGRQLAGESSSIPRPEIKRAPSDA